MLYIVCKFSIERDLFKNKVERDLFKIKGKTVLKKNYGNVNFLRENCFYYIFRL